MKLELKFVLSLLVVFLFSGKIQAQYKTGVVELVEVQKIWDQAPHNAFTDLIRFQNKWFCVFRESSGHVKNDGALRVISSADGKVWESAALITSVNSDLRDAKITITSKGQLMLSGAEAFHDKSEHSHQSLAWFSSDGKNWSKRVKIGDPDFWLWRTSWHNKNAYSFGYACGSEKSLRLYKSKNGKDFKTLVKDLQVKGYPNETSIVFKDDTAFCLLRRDGEKKSGLLGISTSLYKKWQWKDLGVRIGGPDMILLPNGKLLAAVRLYENENWHPARTSLCWINQKTGEISEALKLPSGGDTSYAGMVWYNDLLWVSYYSSHEEKTAIYLAKVKLGDFNSKIVKKIPNSANQGVAVGKRHYFAISNTKITKHDKTTDKQVAEWQADLSNPAFKHFKHLNSGTVVGNKLYCAHSRYNEDPNDNSIEIWNVKKGLLEHETTIRMPRTHGSLTWIDKHLDGSWWMCYAVYGKEINKKTKLVKYKNNNGEFVEVKSWTFPERVTENWGDMSCSGGSWGPDGLLYTTGHDHEKVFVLELNKQEEFKYLWTENNIGFYGQAISWDRFSNKPYLWGIVKRECIVVSSIFGK